MAQQQNPGSENGTPKRGADKSGPMLYIIIGVLVVFYGVYSAFTGKGTWGNWVLAAIGLVIAAIGLWLRQKAPKDDDEGGSAG